MASHQEQPEGSFQRAQLWPQGEILVLRPRERVPQACRQGSVLRWGGGGSDPARGGKKEPAHLAGTEAEAWQTAQEPGFLHLTRALSETSPFTASEQQEHGWRCWLARICPQGVGASASGSRPAEPGPGSGANSQVDAPAIPRRHVSQGTVRMKERKRATPDVWVDSIGKASVTFQRNVAQEQRNGQEQNLFFDVDHFHSSSALSQGRKGPEVVSLT